MPKCLEKDQKRENTKKISQAGGECRREFIRAINKMQKKSKVTRKKI